MKYDKKINFFIIRDELDGAEYEETKEDTIEQLKELNESLRKLVKGDISLVSTLGAVQMVKCDLIITQIIYVY